MALQVRIDLRRSAIVEGDVSYAPSTQPAANDLRPSKSLAAALTSLEQVHLPAVSFRLCLLLWRHVGQIWVIIAAAARAAAHASLQQLIAVCSLLPFRGNTSRHAMIRSRFLVHCWSKTIHLTCVVCCWF